MFDEKVYKIKYEEKEYILSTGKYARQAAGSVMLTCGGTTMLITVTRSNDVKDGQDFFPLTVDYIEKFYANGRFPGGFIKRESKPSTDEILISRLIDRPIRPLFPEGFFNSVHIVITVMSFDGINLPENMATLGVSFALSISDIPFDGPVAGVTIGYKNGEYLINPDKNDKENRIYLSIAGTKDAITMVEAESNEVTETEMLNAIMYGHKYIKEICNEQENVLKTMQIEKMKVEEINFDSDIVDFVDKFKDELKRCILIPTKLEKYQAIDDLYLKIEEEYTKKYNENKAMQIFENQGKNLSFEEILEKLNLPEIESKDKKLKELRKYYLECEKKIVRDLIIFDKYRTDGRKIDEIRPLFMEIDNLKTPHGSSMFTRGETQAIVSVTLGSKEDEQIVDIMEEEKRKRFFLHYNFPPYSVGEVGFMKAPGRRELGHGNLAERALKNVMPEFDDFPYTVRVVSEITESNGSSSQASICGGSLALMAAGVPIKSTVAGIAMGLVKENDEYTVLTDIQGLEDHLGDMDFKVAGTRDGITAIQMDIKIKGINEEIMKNALEQALKGRLYIIEQMEKVISKPRLELAENAPKILKFNILPTMIPIVIGTGGKTIKSIIEETNVTIDIDDFGVVIIYGVDIEMMNLAKKRIEELTFVVEVGKTYKGKVVNVTNFGAFLEISKNKEGLLHISEIATKKIDKVEKYIKIGDVLDVIVTKLDPANNDKFSLALVEKFKVEE